MGNPTGRFDFLRTEGSFLLDFIVPKILELIILNLHCNIHGKLPCLHVMPWIKDKLYMILMTHF